MVRGWSIRVPAAAGADSVETFWIKQSLSLEVPFQFLQQLATAARLGPEVFHNHVGKALALFFQFGQDFVSLSRDRDCYSRHACTIPELNHT